VRKLDELGALTLIGDEILVLDTSYYNERLGVVFDANAEILIF
jgi:hypothetical protein